MLPGVDLREEALKVRDAPRLVQARRQLASGVGLVFSDHVEDYQLWCGQFGVMQVEGCHNRPLTGNSGTCAEDGCAGRLCLTGAPIRTLA
ncbi:hypothetical protein GCM10009784_01590 [Arthrobacter parietis]|uniref:Uncharacterized protein n=1 Tax=Arthrobacter parietis TaxID=271434 RepID=A0ABN3AN46_9MICC